MRLTSAATHTKFPVATQPTFPHIPHVGRAAAAPCMANPFYESGQQRAAKVNDLFAAIAHRYDLLNDLQSAGAHRLWKRRLVQLANVTPGAQALDVCCGTGDIALRLTRAGAEVSVEFWMRWDGGLWAAQSGELGNRTARNGARGQTRWAFARARFR